MKIKKKTIYRHGNKYKITIKLVYDNIIKLDLYIKSWIYIHRGTLSVNIMHVDSNTIVQCIDDLINTYEKTVLLFKRVNNNITNLK